MIKIPLWAKNGTVRAHALVDDEDVPRLIKYRWCLNNTGYARTSISSSEQILMHRFIMKLPKNKPWVDHINRNKLDNRKENLRTATSSLNNHNRGLQRNNRSGHTGVYLHKKTINNKKYAYWVCTFDALWVGQFKSKIKAIKARKLLEKQYGYR